MRKRPPPALLLAIAGTLAAAIAVVAILVGTSGSSSSRTSTAGAASGFDGAALPPGVKAESFTLTDQNGRRVSLSDYRGQVVVVAFLYSTCGATCIVIAQQIRGALDDLDERHSHPPAVLIVSADPATDTRAHVARFLSEVSLSGRVRYLTGAPSQLRQIWRSYDVTPASAGAAAFDRVAAVLLIDARGNKRVLFESEQLTPESLSHDIGLLDGASTHP
jgi:cytochrome oxidase Cu insertion factor (SCO1/SenC/PrrC family)